MATTRLIPHHISSGRTIAESMRDRFDYGQDPVKTLSSSLMRAYKCDPMTADAEFLLTKAMYKAITGREQERDADVLCYQIRQSFPPGNSLHKRLWILAMSWRCAGPRAATLFLWCPTRTGPILMCTSITTPPPWTVPGNSAISFIPALPCGGSRTGYVWSMNCLLFKTPSCTARGNSGTMASG